METVLVPRLLPPFNVRGVAAEHLQETVVTARKAYNSSAQAPLITRAARNFGAISQ